MADPAALDELTSRIHAGYSVMLLETWEEDRWEDELYRLADELERGVVRWTLTTGLMPPLKPEFETLFDPADLLDALADYPPQHLFLLQDLPTCWDRPDVIRRLKDLSLTLGERQQAILVLGSPTHIPRELEKTVLRMPLPLPDLEDLQAVWRRVRSEQASRFESDPAGEERLVQGALGLTADQASRAMRRAVQGHSKLEDEVYATLIAEKRHLVSGSDFLEFYNLDDGIGEVGGLDNLKGWLKQRSQAFTSEARDQGIPLPKGMLLLGVQGCGKSLTARATAALLHFPLVRLDASHLLSGEQGASERNMRQVLKVLEMIAPTVLWIDELEKGFAGLGHDGSGAVDATMSRIFGQFLTWMEQRKAPVFTVATANSVEQLPPELLRKGRFDELFFVDLPNWHERQHVLRIHIEKRGWKAEKYDLEELSHKAEGFSGAEIEQVVSSALLESYTRGRVLSQEDLLAALDQTVPLSVTMEEKIFELREWAKGRCRPATSDSRVLQMLEEEERRLAIEPEEDFGGDGRAEWETLAEYGQIRAAVVAFVTSRDRATFDDLAKAFSKFVPVAGKQGIALKSDPGLVLWSGYSQPMAALLVKLVASRRLFLHKGEADMYPDVESQPDLPLLEEWPEERVGSPVWFPAYLTHFPPDDPDGRLERIARIQLGGR